VSTLRLVRHGQASYGASNYDLLSACGITQARALGAKWGAALLAIDTIYSGPMQRQRETARHLRAAAAEAGHALPEPIVVDGLAEYPAFELLARALPAMVAHDPTLAGLAGAHPSSALIDRAVWRMVDDWTSGALDTGALETFAHFVTRVTATVDELLGQHPGTGRSVVAVTSGGPIGVAAKLALDLSPRATVDLWRLVRNASVSELLWRTRDDARQLSLLGWNHVEHLAADLLTYR